SGLIAALDTHLRAHGAGDRLDEVLDELARIREEVGWPPVAAPIGQILASQALLHVLSAARYQTVVDELRGLIAGRFGSPPGPCSSPPATSRPRTRPSTWRSSAPRQRGSHRARRSCCCSRSSARRPSRCSRRSAAEPSGRRATPPAGSTRRGRNASARSCASS